MSHNSLIDRAIRIRPTLDQARIIGVAKPTYVVYGISGGYSLPIFNNNDEELIYRTVLPTRWDGVTPVKAKIYCYLPTAQDVGDKFNIDFLYKTMCCDTDVIPPTSLNESKETTIVEGRTAQYSTYCVEIILPHVNANPSDFANGCIRRIAASSSEITGEIVVMYVELIYSVNKMFGEY